MTHFLQDLKRYFRYALRSAKAELKSEVADSYLNWLWWIIEPFCFMLIYVFVFGYVFKNKTENFASFVLIGIAGWEFFNRMISGSVKLILNNRDIVSKVYIPKYILLVAKSFTYLFKMFISLGIAALLILVQGVPLSWYMLLIIPVIAVLYLVTFAFSLLLMHYGVYINDLANLTKIVLKMVFYVSGIFYNISEKLGTRHAQLTAVLLRVNPIAFFLDAMRTVLLNQECCSFNWLLIWLVIGLAVLALGVHIVHKHENSYAKVI